ncbi:MAG: hypothetical protein KAJ19_12560, partial [Gammaproteobacteria bacterium]|nr:hypothetical protein [Gammaproteobacteria bacterium]
QGIPLPAGMIQKDDKIKPLTNDQRAVLTPEDIEIYERKIYYYPYPGETNDQTIKRILAEEAEKIKVEKQLKRTYSQDPAKRKKTVVPRGKYNTKRKKIAKIKRKIAKNIEQQQQNQ